MTYAYETNDVREWAGELYGEELAQIAGRIIPDYSEPRKFAEFHYCMTR